MTKEERYAIIASCLNSPEGKRRFKDATHEAAAWASDQFPQGSLGEALGRVLAGMPAFKRPPGRLV